MKVCDDSYAPHNTYRTVYATTNNTTTSISACQIASAINMHFTPIAFGLLATVASCASSPSAYIALSGNDKDKRDTPLTSIDPGGPIQSCTSVITSTAPFGCAITEAAHTATETIDCYGCVMSTTTVVNEFFGIGPVCFGGRKTTLMETTTATATACSTG